MSIIWRFVFTPTSWLSTYSNLSTEVTVCITNVQYEGSTKPVCTSNYCKAHFSFVLLHLQCSIDDARSAWAHLVIVLTWTSMTSVHIWLLMCFGYSYAMVFESGFLCFSQFCQSCLAQEVMKFPLLMCHRLYVINLIFHTPMILGTLNGSAACFQVLRYSLTVFMLKLCLNYFQLAANFLRSFTSFGYSCESLFAATLGVSWQVSIRPCHCRLGLWLFQYKTMNIPVIWI